VKGRYADCGGGSAFRQRIHILEIDPMIAARASETPPRVVSDPENRSSVGYPGM
jgi:hypothetical protein